MNKGERTELKSIIRQQFKVLRHEVEQRQAELTVEATEKVAEHFSESDRKWENTLLAGESPEVLAVEYGITRAHAREIILGAVWREDTPWALTDLTEELIGAPS